MKVGIAIFTFFVFIYWGVPFFYHAMKKHDYDNLYHGMQDAKISGNSYHENTRTYKTYTERYMNGEVRK